MHTKTGHKGHLIFFSLVLLLIFCWIEVDLYAPAFPDLRGSASALFSAMRMLIMASAIFISGQLYRDTFKSVAGWMLALIGCGFLLILGSRPRSGFQPTAGGVGPH